VSGARMLHDGRTVYEFDPSISVSRKSLRHARDVVNLIVLAMWLSGDCAADVTITNSDTGRVWITVSV
jgi:hypothetical protein